MKVVEYSISQALNDYKNIDLSEQDQAIANQILKEIISRLTFLNNVVLEYLTLNRASGRLQVVKHNEFHWQCNWVAFDSGVFIRIR